MVWLNTSKRHRTLRDFVVCRRHQEKVWSFRDERHKIGRGPAASIGDADDFALGLGDEFEDATPRRRCILDSLSLEVELVVVRISAVWSLSDLFVSQKWVLFAPQTLPGTGFGEIESSMVFGGFIGLRFWGATFSVLSCCENMVRTLWCIFRTLGLRSFRESWEAHWLLHACTQGDSCWMLWWKWRHRMPF